MKPQSKLWTQRPGGASWLLNTMMCWEGNIPRSKEIAWNLCIPLCAQTMPHAALHFLIYILYSKSVIISGFGKFCEQFNQIIKDE